MISFNIEFLFKYIFFLSFSDIPGISALAVKPVRFLPSDDFEN